MKNVKVMQSYLLSRAAMSGCGLELAFSDEDKGCPSNVRDSWNYKLPSTICIDQGPGKPCGGGWEQAEEGLLLSCIKEEGIMPRENNIMTFSIFIWCILSVKTYLISMSLVQCLFYPGTTGFVPWTKHLF